MKSNKENICVVTIKDVSKVFGTNSRQTTALKNIYLSVNKGELILIFGPSGSGKTTLLTLIAGLIEATKGTVVLFGKDIRSYSEVELQKVRSSKIGFIFQNFMLIDSLTVGENVKLVMEFAGKSKSESAERTNILLHELNIEHIKDKLPTKISQGEKQRVAIARAIANDAEIIIADEPTASLDTEQGLEIINILGNYAKKQGKCVIVTSHDLRLIDYADTIIKLKDGMII